MSKRAWIVGGGAVGWPMAGYRTACLGSRLLGGRRTMLPGNDGPVSGASILSGR